MKIILGKGLKYMRRKKYTIEEVKKYVEERGGKCFSKSYKNNKEKLEFQCGTCENTWQTTFKDVKVSKTWCPYCAGRHNNSINLAKKIALERNGLCLSETYSNNKKNLRWKCGLCMCIWEARLDRVKSGTWCPRCRRSHGEKAIAEILDYYGFKYVEEYRIKETGQRFDFYIPDQNLAIEFDGLQHFQIYKKYSPDEKTLEKAKCQDIQKIQYCLKKGIRLLRIAYDCKFIRHAILFALEFDVSVVFSDREKYQHMIERVEDYYILSTGIGEQ